MMQLFKEEFQKPIYFILFFLLFYDPLFTMNTSIKHALQNMQNIHFNKNNLYFIANYVKYYQHSMQCI